MNFNFFSLALKLLIISVITFSLQNCTTENEMEQEDELQLNDNPVLDKLLKMGFIKEQILELDDFYLVEGDLMFSKNIKDYENNEIFDKQASTNNLVSQSNVTSMSVFVDSSTPTSGTDNWRTEINQAINDWNTINNCINFVLTTNSNADIIVKSDNGSLPNLTIASAGWPSGNQPYHTVLINLDFLNNFTVPTGTKRYNMVHELGHCIGFRHTNWAAIGEGTGSVGANLITGTPNADNNSVMNGGTALSTWNGFSNFDIVGANALYSCASFSLTGASVICNTSSTVYTLNGNLVNSNVDWSVTSGLEIVSSTNNNITVRRTSSSVTGTSIIEAQVDGKVIRKTVSVGIPDSITRLFHVSTFGCTVGEIETFSRGATQYQWSVSGGRITSPVNGTSYTGVSSAILFDPVDSNYGFTIKVRAKNSCGYTPWYTKYIPTSCDPGNDGGTTPL